MSIVGTEAEVERAVRVRVPPEVPNRLGKYSKERAWASEYTTRENEELPPKSIAKLAPEDGEAGRSPVETLYVMLGKFASVTVMTPPPPVGALPDKGYTPPPHNPPTMHALLVAHEAHQ